MRHLPSPKAAAVFALLISFTVLPAAPARAEDGSTIASQVSSFVAELLAAIFDSPDDSAPQFIPNGVAGQGSLGVDESAPQYWPGG